MSEYRSLIGTSSLPAFFVLGDGECIEWITDRKSGAELGETVERYR
ncbi:hypothetical protein SAMN05216226_102109 [Halovenus aranensis]|jgi:hypothetical protein|uniref:Uncharacterized protein n=1 Tax=Halovenus aranensis TaxID=890420 RepID=A0A1G8SSI9_9EURY|nr:hypothetical protein [Halovenus aranensis]SDJ31745.1 hypothetical protein SAMN05216226_102109 [Halovenus aranensis]